MYKHWELYTGQEIVENYWDDLWFLYRDERWEIIEKLFTPYEIALYTDKMKEEAIDFQVSYDDAYEELYEEIEDTEYDWSDLRDFENTIQHCHDEIDLAIKLYEEKTSFPMEAILPRVKEKNPNPQYWWEI